jgi:ActR/RegA family two-component response regulator
MKATRTPRRNQRILIMDDEDTFLRSTADLLRREGFECECAPSTDTAAALLTESEFELVIADIQMAGNSDLEFISTMHNLKKGVPVILVTGYPSIRTAVKAFELPVMAYLVKPIDFAALLTQVHKAIQTRDLLLAVSTARHRVLEWSKDLKGIEDTLRSLPVGKSPVSVDAFLSLTFTNVIHALTDIKAMIEVATGDMSQEGIRRAFANSRPLVLLEAIRETISVLENTKGSFKSKELGELRRKLEGLVSEPSP